MQTFQPIPPYHSHPCPPPAHQYYPPPPPYPPNSQYTHPPPSYQFYTPNTTPYYPSTPTYYYPPQTYTSPQPTVLPPPKPHHQTTENRFTTQSSSPIEPHIRSPTVELPLFYGDKAYQWLQNCKGVFELAGMTNEYKLKWAAAHIRGKAKNMAE
jgi:hypothetical protein